MADPVKDARQVQDMLDRLDRPATEAERPTTLRGAHQLLGRDMSREVSRPPVTDRRSTRR